MANHGIVAHPEADLERAELETPSLAGRTLRLGSLVLGACIAFYFLGFLFAYAYLKVLDTNHQWRPAKVHASVPLGLAVLLLVLCCAATYVLAVRALQRAQWNRWRAGTRLSLLFGLAGLVVLVVQLFGPGFPYGRGAYASVFVGWFWSVAVALLGVLYAVGALSAQSHKVPPETRQHADDLSSPAGLQPGAEGVRFIVVLVAGVEVLAWVLLYLVR